MFKKPDSKQSFPKLEEAILEYWEKNNIFQKSLSEREGCPEYVFYDGPPFATGLPHYGHILAGCLKDVMPRYQTMRGYRVERKWGWDCHGLPVENLIEKDLNLADKKALEKFGIDNFNEACRSSVLKYVNEWRTTVKRMGRWVDFEDSYKTMDPEFMESVWWAFRSLWDKKLVYRGKKAMHICPRCVTPLSNFEVGLGYKDVRDLSVTVKCRVKNKPFSILAWTTTPWTLPGNMFLAVGKEITYVVLELREDRGPNKAGEQLVLAEDTVAAYFPPQKDRPSPYKKIAKMKGKDLLGLSYEPLFDCYVKARDPRVKKVYRVLEADFVSTQDGTGVVHIAAAYGEDDLQIAKREKVEGFQHVAMDGTFNEVVTQWKGMMVKETKDPGKTDRLIAKDLEERGLLFESKTYQHSYPHCWRCESPLLNYTTDAWYVAVEQIKKQMLNANSQINWVPSHIKDGRFGKWLENARDWCISRNRYWGTPLPIWSSDDGRITECLGSMAELRSKLKDRVTKVTFIRHGESEGNTIELYQGQVPGTSLTPLGRKQAKDCAALMAKIHKKEKFDVILTSPLLRTVETAKIIGQKLKKKPVVDESVCEINFGNLEGTSRDENRKDSQRRKALPDDIHYTDKCGETGESHHDVETRMQEWLKTILKKYKGKSVAVVSHSDPIRCLLRGLKNDPLRKFYTVGHFPKCQPKEVYFDSKTGQLLDLHKHFVDTMVYRSKGKVMRRIPEVLDCWFESGSMPYAQAHYPFENRESFEKNFPAQFIAEGLDQTRGWFYTLVVLSAALFDQPAFKNVIVNGIVLAEDGQKMSKSKRNYPPPENIFNTYGADAMRLYLMNSPVVKADDLRFSEKGVEELLRSIMIPLWNSYSFFVTYAEIDGWKPTGRLYFARHGQTDWNRDHRIQGHSNNSLNPTGVQEAHDLASRIKNLPIDIVLSSDLERARETTSIIYEGFKGRKKLPKLIIDQSFREQDFGEFNGQYVHEVLKKKPKNMSESYYYRTAQKTGQPLVDYETQVLTGLARVQKKFPNANILIVSHSGVGHVMLKKHMGLESWTEYFNNVRSFRNAELMSLAPALRPRTNKLDAWILSELSALVGTTTSALESYDLQKATDPLVRFIDTLTNWYIRRSRRRFWKSENDGDKAQAYETLYSVLTELSQLLAPFTPFVAEEIYRNLTGKESVHLSNWPKVNESSVNHRLNEQIATVRKIVTLGHAARSTAQVKVRQPLSTVEIALPPSISEADMADQISVIAEELNVKKVVFLKKLPKTIQPIARPNAKVLGPIHGQLVQEIIKAAKAGQFKASEDGTITVTLNRKKITLRPDKNEVELGYESAKLGRGHTQEVRADQGIVVILDTTITADLLREGIARDLVRTIQDLRKEAGLNVSDRIRVGIKTRSKQVQKALKEHLNYIRKETLADQVTDKKLKGAESVTGIENEAVIVTLEKIS